MERMDVDTTVKSPSMGTILTHTLCYVPIACVKDDVDPLECSWEDLKAIPLMRL